MDDPDSLFLPEDPPAGQPAASFPPTIAYQDHGELGSKTLARASLHNNNSQSRPFYLPSGDLNADHFRDPVFAGDFVDEKATIRADSGAESERHVAQKARKKVVEVLACPPGMPAHLVAAMWLPELPPVVFTETSASNATLRAKRRMMARSALDLFVSGYEVVVVPEVEALGSDVVDGLLDALIAERDAKQLTFEVDVTLRIPRLTVEAWQWSLEHCVACGVATGSVLSSLSTKASVSAWCALANESQDSQFGEERLVTPRAEAFSTVGLVIDYASMASCDSQAAFAESLRAFSAHVEGTRAAVVVLVRSTDFGLASAPGGPKAINLAAVAPAEDPRSSQLRWGVDAEEQQDGVLRLGVAAGGVAERIAAHVSCPVFLVPVGEGWGVNHADAFGLSHLGALARAQCLLQLDFAQSMLVLTVGKEERSKRLLQEVKRMGLYVGPASEFGPRFWKPRISETISTRREPLPAFLAAAPLLVPGSPALPDLVAHAEDRTLRCCNGRFLACLKGGQAATTTTATTTTTTTTTTITAPPVAYDDEATQVIAEERLEPFRPLPEWLSKDPAVDPMPPKQPAHFPFPLNVAEIGARCARAGPWALKKAEEVLPRIQSFGIKDGDPLCLVSKIGGSGGEVYTVNVTLTGKTRSTLPQGADPFEGMVRSSTCTCPDFEKRSNRVSDRIPECKHVHSLLLRLASDEAAKSQGDITTYLRPKPKGARLDLTKDDLAGLASVVNQAPEPPPAKRHKENDHAPPPPPVAGGAAAAAAPAVMTAAEPRVRAVPAWMMAPAAEEDKEGEPEKKGESGKGKGKGKRKGALEQAVRGVHHPDDQQGPDPAPSVPRSILTDDDLLAYCRHIVSTGGTILKVKNPPKDKPKEDNKPKEERPKEPTPVPAPVIAAPVIAPAPAPAPVHHEPPPPPPPAAPAADQQQPPVDKRLLFFVNSLFSASVQSSSSASQHSQHSAPASRPASRPASPPKEQQKQPITTEPASPVKKKVSVFEVLGLKEK